MSREVTHQRDLDSGHYTLVSPGRGVVIAGDCPVCGQTVEFLQFCCAFSCPGCGKKLEAQHDCCYNDETQEEFCFDYLLEVQ